MTGLIKVVIAVVQRHMLLRLSSAYTGHVYHTKTMRTQYPDVEFVCGCGKYMYYSPRKSKCADQCEMCGLLDRGHQ